MDMFLFFSSYVAFGTPRMAPVNELRSVRSTETAVRALVHANRDIVYTLEPLMQDVTRGTVVTFHFLPLVSLHISYVFGVLVRRQLQDFPCVLW